jgi:hypothetical protein
MLSRVVRQRFRGHGFAEIDFPALGVAVRSRIGPARALVHRLLGGVAAALSARVRADHPAPALRLLSPAALGALGWLAWDWQHERQLASAEDAIFDQIIGFRPWEPKPSRQVVVVEIDECSIQYMRERGAGGWPWSRQLHADLLDALDRAGARAVGFDVQFTDASAQDPQGDVTLEAFADGGAGRFVFGSTRLHPDYDPGSTLRASQAPSSYPLVARPRNDPPVALLLPYGKAMARNSALAERDACQ